MPKPESRAEWSLPRSGDVDEALEEAAVPSPAEAVLADPGHDRPRAGRRNDRRGRPQRSSRPRVRAADLATASFNPSI